MSRLSKRERSIASKFRKYEKARAEAKKFYDRADRLLGEIGCLAESTEIRKLRADLEALLKKQIPPRIKDDGRILRITDNTRGEDIILGWGHGSVRRFELKAVDP